MNVLFFCGISGAGKNTVMKEIGAINVRSSGTRAIRSSETDEDFIPTTIEELSKLKEAGRTLNWPQMFGTRYSFTKDEFELQLRKAKAEKRDLGFGIIPNSIDEVCHGILEDNPKMNPIIVYLKMPTDPTAIMSERMAERGDSDPENVKLRIKQAKSDANSFENTLFEGEHALCSKYTTITLDASKPLSEVIHEFHSRIKTIELDSQKIGHVSKR